MKLFKYKKVYKKKLNFFFLIVKFDNKNNIVKIISF